MPAVDIRAFAGPIAFNLVSPASLTEEDLMNRGFSLFLQSSVLLYGWWWPGFLPGMDAVAGNALAADRYR